MNVISRRFLGLFIFTILFMQWQNNVIAAKTNETPNYKIVKKETLKKGGQLDPLIRPRYTLIKAYAALKRNEGLSEEKVKTVLDEIITEIRASDDPDAISVHLHQSIDHVEGSIPFARAEWWPKGHSLSPDNVVNIKNKNTHETKYSINLPEKVDESKVVTRLPESKRKEIFTALVKSEDRADAEAEEKYPFDGSKIPMNKLANYDFKTAILNFTNESNRLQNKYRKKLLKKYRITEEELQKISTEAISENWPMPK